MPLTTLTNYQIHRMIRRITHQKRIAGKWNQLPEGWTEESVQHFWESISGDDEKHPVTKCIEKMQGSVDDPGAFCASLKDKAEGSSWRHESRGKQGAKGFDPDACIKRLMRNLRTMVNAASRKGSDGGLDDLGSIGSALNWLKVIKQPEQTSTAIEHAQSSLKGISGSGPFLECMKDLIKNAEKNAPKRYPSMPETAKRNALSDLADAVVSMVMVKNKAQRAIMEPEFYQGETKAAYKSVQKRLESFSARHLTPPEEPAGKPKITKPKKKTEEPKSKETETKGEPQKEESTPPEEEMAEPMFDAYGLAGRYKNRSEGNPGSGEESKKKKAAEQPYLVEILDPQKIDSKALRTIWSKTGGYDLPFYARGKWTVYNRQSGEVRMNRGQNFLNLPESVFDTYLQHGLMRRLAGKKASAMHQTILRQLGGYSRLKSMIGVRQVTNASDGIYLDFPNRKGPNHVKIILKPNDTYDIEFYRIQKFESRPVKIVHNVYAEQLASTFEDATGLRLSL